MRGSHILREDASLRQAREYGNRFPKGKPFTAKVGAERPRLSAERVHTEIEGGKEVVVYEREIGKWSRRRLEKWSWRTGRERETVMDLSTKCAMQSYRAEELKPWHLHHRVFTPSHAHHSLIALICVFPGTRQQVSGWLSQPLDTSCR